MASVYAAMDEKLDRRVAIKILHQHLARNNDIRERFLLEAKTVSTLDHPNIIKVYDFSGLDSEQLWMVTEILYGVDLAEYVKRYPKSRLHPIVAILITREVCRALFEVHKLQIVHRDIKPENIMLLDSGQVKLMDFGIAKVHRANATQTGTFMGSPSYMSPEQIRGSDVDVRADIYSLSVLFYEIVTGVLPYSGQTTAEVINKIMVGRYTSPNLLAPDLPFIINEIINKGLKSPKEERFQDITQLSQALDQFLRGFGFGESRVELEQYTTNRLAFDDRLAKLKLPKTSIPRIESHKNILDQSKPASSRSQHTAVTAHISAVDHNAVTKALPNPGPSRASTTPPRSARPVDGNHSNSQPRSHAPQQKHSSHRPAPSNDQPTQILPQTLPQNRQPTQGPGAPQHRATVPPLSQHQGRPHSFRTPPQKAIIREVGSHEKRRKNSNSSTFVLFGLIAAIALVFVFGGEKLMNRVKKDSARVTQQIDPLKKKRIAKDDREDGSTLNGESTARLDSVVEVPNPTVESQTVVIDGNKTPTVVEKDVPTFKTTTKPIVTSKGSPNSTSKTKIASLPPQETRGKSRPPQTPPESIAQAPTASTSEVRPPVLASVPERTQAPSDQLPPEPAKKGDAGTLKISASLPADIYIDGKSYSSTNDEDVANNGIRLNPGNYSLRLKRKGYKMDEQQIQIKAGEMKSVNITLLKTVDLVELNIRSNRTPATLVIEDTRDGGRRKEMTLTKHSLTLNLKPGSYRVAVTFEQEVVSRPIELRENEGSQTFNAEFK